MISPWNSQRSPDSDAPEAARLLAERGLSGVLVVDGEPYAILPGSQLLRFVVPTYAQNDPALAAVVDEPHADRICASLAGHTVRDLLPRG